MRCLMKKLICIFLIIILHSLVIGNWTLAIASEYILVPNDLLEIHIIGQKDLDTQQQIAPDGSISLPLLGRVIAGGQTLEQFEGYLIDEFSKYIKKPQVVVYLNPRPIYVVQHDLKDNTCLPGY